MDEESGEKIVSTDERIVKRVIEEHVDLVGEIAVAYDGLLVDFDKQFPSIASALRMLF